MATKMLFYSILLVNFIISIYGLLNTDLLSYGLNYTGQANEITINVHGLFQNTSLLDGYAKIIVPGDYSAFKILGVELSREIYINYNGYITFGTNYNSVKRVPLNETNRDIIAVYFSDNDLRRPNGLLHHRFTTDVIDLTYADNLIRKEGFKTFKSQYCIVATWENLKFYVREAAERSNPDLQSENTYQLIICTDATDGHIIFQYPKLEWSRSQETASEQAQAGWYIHASTNTQWRHFSLPKSGTQGITELATTTNTREATVTGRWMRSTPTDACYGKNDGVYKENCTSYFYCCGGSVEKVESCPPNYVYHSDNKHCVESKLYSCGENVDNFCDKKSDGRYPNELTTQTNDFFQCKKGLTRVLTCPNGIDFDVGNPRCTR